MRKDGSYNNGKKAYKHLINSATSLYFSGKKRKEKENRKNEKAEKQRKQNYINKEAIKYAKEIFFKYYERLIDNSLKSFLNYIKNYNKSHKISLLEGYYSFPLKIEDISIGDTIVQKDDFRRILVEFIADLIQYVLNRNMNYKFIACYSNYDIHCSYIKGKGTVDIEGSIYFKVIDNKDKIKKKCNRSIYEIITLYNNMYKEKEKENKKLFDSICEDYKKSLKEKINALNQKPKELAHVLFNKYRVYFVDKVLFDFLDVLENLKKLPYQYDCSFDTNMKKDYEDAIDNVDYSLKEKYCNALSKELAYLIKKELKDNLPFKIHVKIRYYNIYHVEDKTFYPTIRYSIDYKRNIITEKFKSFLKNFE